MTPAPNREILVVEDNPSDAMLAREAFREAGVRSRCRSGDGYQAMSYLRGEDRSRAASYPELILLDLKLPGKRRHPGPARDQGGHDLRRIPILVLTTSAARRDILDTYELHANSYLPSPSPSRSSSSSRA